MKILISILALVTSTSAYADKRSTMDVRKQLSLEGYHACIRSGVHKMDCAEHYGISSDWLRSNSPPPKKKRQSYHLATPFEAECFRYKGRYSVSYTMNGRKVEECDRT